MYNPIVPGTVFFVKYSNTSMTTGMMYAVTSNVEGLTL